MVLNKTSAVPDKVTAKRPTVAVRMPAHPIAAALLEASGVPIAAPSANRSTQVSPTRAEHVIRALSGRIDIILDGGPTQIGIESTVVDLTRERVVILRPGSVTKDQIEKRLGEPVEMFAGAVRDGESAISPGMLAKHYAPRCRVECVDTEKMLSRARELIGDGSRLGILALSTLIADSIAKSDAVIQIVQMSARPTPYAQEFYADLHELDDRQVDVILIERPPTTEEWQAVNDRLQRMSQA
jgi:L-threonylcarbamoyladenylate synthase